MKTLPNKVEYSADVKVATAELLALKIEGLDCEAALDRRARRFFLAHMHKAGEIATDLGRPQLLPTAYEHEVQAAARRKVREYRRQADAAPATVEEAV